MYRRTPSTWWTAGLQDPTEEAGASSQTGETPDLASSYGHKLQPQVVSALQLNNVLARHASGCYLCLLDEEMSAELA